MDKKDSMINIISYYNDISTYNPHYFSKKTIKRLDYIKNVSALNEDIIKIIHDYYESNKYIYDFDKLFINIDTKNIKCDELINIIRSVDDLNSGLLLITSLLSHNTTKRTSEINHQKIINHFIELDKVYKQRNPNVMYNTSSILKMMCKYREKNIRTVYKQAKDILKCFSLFILVPAISNDEFRSLFGDKLYNRSKTNHECDNLTDLLTECLSKNQYVYKKFKFYKFEQKIAFYKRSFNIIKKIGILLKRFCLDILNLIYFFNYGFKNINKEISIYQKDIQKDINRLKKITIGVTNNLNNGIVINKLYDYIFDMKNFDVEQEYKNECTFSDCSSNFIKENNRIITRLMSNYIHLNKYLYEERQVLDEINKKL